MRRTVVRLEQNKPDWNQHLDRIGREQDRHAFQELFEHFSPNLKAFLMRSGGVSTEIAEELVQETMIKVWRKAPSFSPAQASASTWIYTIARNTRIDWHRKQQRQDESLVSAEDLYADREIEEPDASVLRLNLRTSIEEGLKSLPAEQSEVLRLMYFQGKSGQQVADMLELPLGTVKSRIRLALSRLKISFGPAIKDAALGDSA